MGAFNGEGKLEGYVLLSRRSGQLYAYEAAANTWPAVAALLRYQTHLSAAEPESPAELSWPLPLTDSTYYLLADHLPLRSEIASSPDGGWMARMGSFSVVVRALLPLWQERWRQHSVDWTGVFALVVGETRCNLELSPSMMRLADRLSSGEEQEVRLSQQVFTQLVFGFRPIRWAARQAGQHIPADLVALLDLLFPCKQSWIAGSDYF